MTTSNAQPVWLFDFALESEAGTPVPAEVPEELLDAIIAWVEDRNLQIGGGYRPPRPDELEHGPAVPVEATDDNQEIEQTSTT